MKKIILLLAVSISIGMTSCNSDDDGAASVDMIPVPSEDKLIGSWKLTKEFENDVELTLEECKLENIFTVTDDLKYRRTVNVPDSTENGSCELVSTVTGTWKNLGNDIYKFNFDSGEIGFFENKITFSGNTMSQESTDSEGKVSKIIYSRI